MAFLAPYASYMKLGQGFNSYTQEICIEDAVSITPRIASIPSAPESSASPTVNGSLPNGDSPAAGTAPPPKDATRKDTTATVASETAASSSVVEKAPPPAKNLSQIVTYSSRLVSNMADIVDALNISASASIKYGTVKGSGSASFVNENKVSQSDLNYIITVKVTNAVHTYPDQMKFNPMDDLDPKDFTEVFGDCFISGFLEGGEFSAIISIKVYDKSKISEVKAAAEVDLAIAGKASNETTINFRLLTNFSRSWVDGGSVCEHGQEEQQRMDRHGNHNICELERRRRGQSKLRAVVVAHSRNMTNSKDRNLQLSGISQQLSTSLADFRTSSSPLPNELQPS